MEQLRRLRLSFAVSGAALLMAFGLVFSSPQVGAAQGEPVSECEASVSSGYCCQCDYEGGEVDSYTACYTRPASGGTKCKIGPRITGPGGGYCDAPFGCTLAN